jgi:hypothetical protein
LDHQPDEEVTMRIKRGDDEIDVRLKLGRKSEAD